MHASRLALAAALLASMTACADDDEDTVVVSTRVIEEAPFETYQTFTVLTDELVPSAPELGPDQQAFNETVNRLLVEFMTQEPLCLTYVPPTEVDPANPPDLFAGNGLARSAEEGVVWECVGGWWWGYWGWYWDSCAWTVPVPVEVSVGTMLIAVGEPPPEDPAIGPLVPFVGIAQTVTGVGPDAETKVRDALTRMFAEWPVSNVCPAP